MAHVKKSKGRGALRETPMITFEIKPDPNNPGQTLMRDVDQVALRELFHRAGDANDPRKFIPYYKAAATAILERYGINDYDSFNLAHVKIRDKHQIVQDALRVCEYAPRVLDAIKLKDALLAVQHMRILGGVWARVCLRMEKLSGKDQQVEDKTFAQSRARIHAKQYPTERTGEIADRVLGEMSNRRAYPPRTIKSWVSKVLPPESKRRGRKKKN